MCRKYKQEATNTFSCTELGIRAHVDDILLLESIFDEVDERKNCIHRQRNTEKSTQSHERNAYIWSGPTGVIPHHTYLSCSVCVKTDDLEIKPNNKIYCLVCSTKRPNAISERMSLRMRLMWNGKHTQSPLFMQQNMCAFFLYSLQVVPHFHCFCEYFLVVVPVYCTHSNFSSFSIIHTWFCIRSRMCSCIKWALNVKKKKRN